MARSVEINSYLAYMRSKGLSPHTVDAYHRDLLAFETWLGTHGVGDILEAGASDVNRYIKALRIKKKAAPTVARHVSSLRGFYRWEKQRGLVFINPTEGARQTKVIRKSPPVPVEEDVSKLLRVIDKKTFRGMRDMAMVRLILATGLNVSELLGLKVQDVSSDMRRLCTPREIALTKAASQALRVYLEKARPALGTDSREEKLFVGSGGTAMSRQGFWKNLRAYSEKAGIDYVSPEMLRHYYALGLVMRGEPPEKLMKKLGLKSISAVSEYMTLSRE